MSLTNIGLMSIAEIVGDFGFKGVARQGGVNNWAAGIGGYIAVIYFLIQSLKVGNVTYVNGMWDGVSAILETLAAIIIFGERLNTTSQYIGLAFIICGIFFLKAGGIPY